MEEENRESLQDSEPYSEISHCFPVMCKHPSYFTYFCTKEVNNWLSTPSRRMAHLLSLSGTLQLCRNQWRWAAKREGGLYSPLSQCQREETG